MQNIGGIVMPKTKSKVRIPVKTPGILEVPEGKKVWNLPINHFVALAKRKGRAKISRALTNLKVWNKNKRTPEAKKIRDKVNKALIAIDKEFSKELTANIIATYVKESIKDNSFNN